MVSAKMMDEQAAPMVKQMMPPTIIKAMPTGSGSLLHRFWYLMRRL